MPYKGYTAGCHLSLMLHFGGIRKCDSHLIIRVKSLLMDKENIDALKQRPIKDARLTYKLRNADVYVSADGFHFIDYLDPVEAIPSEIDASQLTEETAAYIETQLQANAKKFTKGSLGMAPKNGDTSNRFRR